MHKIIEFGIQANYYPFKHISRFVAELFGFSFCAQVRRNFSTKFISFNECTHILFVMLCVVIIIFYLYSTRICMGGCEIQSDSLFIVWWCTCTSRLVKLQLHFELQSFEKVFVCDANFHKSLIIWMVCVAFLFFSFSVCGLWCMQWHQYKERSTHLKFWFINANNKQIANFSLWIFILIENRCEINNNRFTKTSAYMLQQWHKIIPNKNLWYLNRQSNVFLWIWQSN